MRRGTGRGGESILVEDGEEDVGSAESLTASLVVEAAVAEGRRKSILTDAVGEVRLGGDLVEAGGGGEIWVEGATVLDVVVAVLLEAPDSVLSSSLIF